MVPDRPSSSLLRARSTAEYDERSRAFRTHVYSVDPSTGTVLTASLASESWFDARGYTVKQSGPGGLVQKMVFDGAGRLTVQYASDGGGDTGYSDAFTVTGDKVLSQTEYEYDNSGNVILTTMRERFHDASGTGALGSPSSGIAARVYYSAAYYDVGGRLTASVNVGTNGGSAYTPPGSVPSRSDTVLVTSYQYGADGRVWRVTDPRGIINETTYDALGRTVRTIENYVDGVQGDAEDKVTVYTYGPAGMTSLSALSATGNGQTTEWVYGVSTGSGSGLTSNDIVGVTKWPDPSTGAASSSEQEVITVNALGQTVTNTDRNGSTHTLGYDVLGRLVEDAVTLLGTDVDGAVRRVETAYDGQGNPFRVTAYDAASGGSVVNEVERVYNGLGQLDEEYQEHTGAVNVSTSPSVQYTYSEMAGGTNHSRLTGVIYPDGKMLSYNYDSGIDDDISRLSSLSDSTGTLEEYDYLGLGTVVRRSRPQADSELTYIKQGMESDGDAGDQYTGLDRFGRIRDQRWLDTDNGNALDRYEYGYDRGSNRVYKDNLVNSALGEVYTYDGTGQLLTFDRGTLNGTKDGITGTVVHAQEWDYGAQGNWDSVTTDGVTENRTHNSQNELTEIDSTTLTYYANGNLTTDEQGRELVYDAWNRLVRVEDGASTVLSEYAYDGLGRRITQDDQTTATELYYSAGWQVLEERVGGNTVTQYVYSPGYVDEFVLRDRDIDDNGSLDERLWVQQDANNNVTSIVDNSGDVVERYGNDPFGAQTVYSPVHAVLSTSVYAFTIGFQGFRHDAVTENVYVRGREYSVTIGRPIQVDPLDLWPDVNWYRWEGNNPVNSLDPSGLGPLDLFIAAGEGLYEGAGNIATGAGNMVVEFGQLARDGGNSAIGLASLGTNAIGISNVYTFDIHSNTIGGYDQSVQNGTNASYLGHAMANGASLGLKPLGEGVADFVQTGDATNASQTAGGVAAANLAGAGMINVAPRVAPPLPRLLNPAKPPAPPVNSGTPFPPNAKPCQIIRNVDPGTLQAGRSDLVAGRLAVQQQLLRQGIPRETPIKVTPQGVIFDGNHGARAAIMEGVGVTVEVIAPRRPVTPKGLVINLPVRPGD